MRFLLTALAAAALVMSIGAAGVSAAKVKLVTEKVPSRQITKTDSQYAYSTAETVWAECKAGGTPLMLGFSGPRAPVSIIYSNNFNSNHILGMAMRRSLGPSGALKATVLCARGRIKATAKDSATGTVSCSRGYVAIGVPIDGGPYWTGPVTSVPVGVRGWKSDEHSKYARAKVICVGSSAFANVKVITKSASFKTGADTTTVTAGCRKGSRPISWGYESGEMVGNRWQSPDSGPAIAMTVPFVFEAVAKGKSGWSLGFATPDGKPATSAAPLKVAITCAKPR